MESQRQHLIATFLEKKQDGLIRELEKQPEFGQFNFPGYMGPDPNNVMRLGTDIRDAMNVPGEDGGRRIVIITPRVIGFREAANQPRTVDYPFTLFEMRFDKSGSGEGRMAYATQLNFDKAKNAIEIENYSSEPIRPAVSTASSRERTPHRRAPPLVGRRPNRDRRWLRTHGSALGATELICS